MPGQYWRAPAATNASLTCDRGASVPVLYGHGLVGDVAGGGGTAGGFSVAGSGRVGLGRARFGVFVFLGPVDGVGAGVAVGEGVGVSAGAGDGVDPRPSVGGSWLGVCHATVVSRESARTHNQLPVNNAQTMAKAPTADTATRWRCMNLVCFWGADTTGRP